MKLIIKSFLTFVQDVNKGMVADDGFPLAGNIAFSSLLALFPFLIFLTSLAGFLGNEALAQAAVDYLLSVAPEELVNPFQDDIHAILTVPTPGVLTLSIFLTFFMAANGVESIRTALNRAYGYKQVDRHLWIFRKFQNLVFILGGAFVLLTLSALIVFGPMGWDRAEAKFDFLMHFSRWFHLLRYPVGLGLLFMALLCGHLFLPAKRQPIRKVIPGIIATIVLWL